MLHVDTLTVSAFRGLPGEASLDLTAPLTLIYAPNGTGKTTFCDGIEWLLTGQVERIATMKDELLRCQHALSDRATFVHAAVREGVRELDIHRDLAEEKPLVVVRGSSAERCTPGEFLDYLAPRIATEFADARSRIVRRREWIVGTHFLSSERLSRLMDSDEANRERRQQLFADLLGVGHLQRLAIRFDKALVAVEKQTVALREVAAGYTSRAQELEDQLTHTGAVVDFASVWASIVQAASALHMPVPSVAEHQSTPDYTDAVRLLAQSVDDSRVAIDQLAPSWRTLLEWITHDEATGGNALATASLLADLATRLQGQAVSNDRDREQLATLSASKKTLSASVHRLGFEISTLGATEDVLHRYVVQHEIGAVSLGALLTKILSVTPESLSARESIARALREDLDDALMRSARLRDARSRLLTMVSEDKLVELHDAAREHLRRSQAHEVELKRSWEALASIGEQIAALGREFAGQHARTGRCPLCTHDWRTVEAFAEAVAGAATGLAPDENAAQRAYLAARDASAEGERQTLAAKVALEERMNLSGSIRELDEQLQPFWQRCELLGFSPSEVPDANAIENILSSCALHATAFASAQSIRDIHAGIEFPVDGAEWKRELADAIRQREAARDEADTARARADAEATALASVIAKNEEAISLLRARFATAEQALAAAKEVESRRDVALQAVGLRHPQTRTTIQEAHVQWETRRQRIAHLGSLLQSASSELLSKTWRAQLAQHREDVEVAEKNVVASTTRVDEVKALQQLLLTSLEAAKKTRVDGLRTTVEALFLKMHAARIAEGVLASPDASSFAVRIGEWMSDAECLSQGQRQDLAIAIFVARARAYGGTFFLDEPLLHLDDLNRVALLDVLRAVAIQSSGRVRLVVTTASSLVLKHLQQKCRGLVGAEGTPLLRAYELVGSVKEGVRPNDLRHR